MTVCTQVNKTQIKRESQNDIRWMDSPPGTSQVGPGDTQGQQTQTDSRPFLLEPSPPRKLLWNWKNPPGPPARLARGMPTHTSGRGSWQAPQEPFCAGGVEAGRRQGRRERSGGRAGSGQRLHKGPSVCPPAPGYRNK